MSRLILLAVLALPAIAFGVPVEKDKLPESKIEATWLGRSVLLHVPSHDGPAVGIWNRDTQIVITRPQTKAIFTRLEKSQFEKMRSNYGGTERRDPGRPGRLGLERPERIIGSVSVTANGKTHSVTQMAEGEQSEELAALAKEILDACEASAKTGVKAGSFDDGLKKIKAKELRPEMIRALVHRLPENAPGEAYLMRIEGRTISTQERAAKGYGIIHRLELSEKELAELVQTMIENEAGRLPVNLWAVHYTDLVIGVLNHEKNMQARQFAGKTPETHGEQQKQFDRIFAAMNQLHVRALKEGKKAVEK